MDATQTLLDRGLGKASPAGEVTGADGGPLVVSWLSSPDEI